MQLDDPAALFHFLPLLLQMILHPLPGGYFEFWIPPMFAGYYLSVPTP